MDAAHKAWEQWLPERPGYIYTADELALREVMFKEGFTAGESKHKPVVDLMRSLSINPAIPQGFRSIMKSALDQ